MKVPRAIPSSAISQESCRPMRSFFQSLSGKNLPPPHWTWPLAVALLTTFLASSGRVALREGDFVHLWSAGRIVASGAGASLYDAALQRATILQATGNPALWGAQENALGAFLYPPTTALLYSPLGVLPLHLATNLMAILTSLLAAWSAWQVSSMLRPGSRWSRNAVLILLYPPVAYSYVLGQNGVLTLAIMCAAWKASTTGGPLRAGLLLGLLAYKPSWLLAFSWVPLAARQPRMFWGMLLAASMLLLSPLPLLGTEPFLAYLESVPSILSLPHQDFYRLALQYDGLALFRRYLPPGMADSLAWGSSLLLVGVTWRRARVVGNPSMDIDWLAMASATACWVNPHLHHYDLAVMAFPACTVLHSSLYASVSPTGRHSVRAMGAWAVLPFNHLAFLLDRALSGTSWPPSPTVGILLLWAWSTFPARQAELPAHHRSHDIDLQ